MAAVGNKVTLHWFRKGLRLHDNPALLEACTNASRCYPIFCIDPHFIKPDVIGVNRFSFLLESLQDLDNSLRARGSRLYILRGRPEEQLLAAIERWQINQVTFEVDIEPYAKVRDQRICTMLREKGVTVSTAASHTLHDLENYIAACHGQVPATYQAFQKLFDRIDKPSIPVDAPAILPSSPIEDLQNPDFNVPSLVDLGYTDTPTSPFRGGESEAINRLHTTVVERVDWVRTFAKPDTSPNSLSPSTTVLSPYLKFGCLSARLFYSKLEQIQSVCKGAQCTKPPVSLTGQLLWREFFYLQAHSTPHFDRMEGNNMCKQVPWHRDTEVIRKWQLGQTGFPFIDAIMTQLRLEGILHILQLMLTTYYICK
jgi:cryptochrome